jgi:hypothetical protein
MSTVTRQNLIAAMAAVIQAAPEEKRNALAEAIEDYAVTFSTSYRQMTRGNTMVNSLLDCIEENAEARIERDSVGTPIRAAH